MKISLPEADESPLSPDSREENELETSKPDKLWTRKQSNSKREFYYHCQTCDICRTVGILLEIVFDGFVESGDKVAFRREALGKLRLQQMDLLRDEALSSPGSFIDW